MDCPKHRNYPVPEHCPICEAIAKQPPRAPRITWRAWITPQAISRTMTALALLFALTCARHDKELAISILIPIFIVGAIVESIES